MSPKLHPVTQDRNRNRYCGPSAISIITGVTAGQAAALIRQRSGQRAVKGSARGTVCNVLKEFGLGVEHVGSNRSVINQARQPGVYLIVYRYRTSNTAGHYAVVGNGRYACGIHPEGVDVEGDTGNIRLSQPVQACWQITGRANRAAGLKRLTAERRAANVLRREDDGIDRNNRRLADAARPYGVDAEQDADSLTFWVYPPEGMYANESDDPHHDQHYCDTFGGAMGRVKEYGAVWLAARVPAKPQDDDAVPDNRMAATPAPVPAVELPRPRRTGTRAAANLERNCAHLTRWESILRRAERKVKKYRRAVKAGERRAVVADIVAGAA